MNSTSPCEKAHTYPGNVIPGRRCYLDGGTRDFVQQKSVHQFNGTTLPSPAEKRMFSKTASMCEGPSSSEIAMVLFPWTLLCLNWYVIERHERIVDGDRFHNSVLWNRCELIGRQHSRTNRFDLCVMSNTFAQRKQTIGTSVEVRSCILPVHLNILICGHEGDDGMPIDPA